MPHATTKYGSSRWVIAFYKSRDRPRQNYTHSKYGFGHASPPHLFFMHASSFFRVSHSKLCFCSLDYLLLTLTFHSWRLSDTRLSDMLVHTKVLVTVKVLFLFRLEICEIVYREQHSTQENQFLIEGLHTLKLSST